MPIQDLARSDVITASPETPVEDLARRMDENDVGSVVITNDDTPVGIVTDRDLAVRCLGNGSNPKQLSASDVMTENPRTIESASGFYDAAQAMGEEGIRRLPVVQDDSLVGIITADDFSELLADEQQQLATVLKNQRPPY